MPRRCCAIAACDMHLVIVGGDAWGLSQRVRRVASRLIEQLGLGGRVTTDRPGAGRRALRGAAGRARQRVRPRAVRHRAARGHGPRRRRAGRQLGWPRRSSSSDGETGVLARSGEPAALADALEPLLRSPELRDTLAARRPGELPERLHRRSDARGVSSPSCRAVLGRPGSRSRGRRRGAVSAPAGAPPS